MLVQNSTIATHYPFVIIGAGPAGLAAAIAIAEQGQRVALFDEAPSPGGQIYRNLENDPLPESVMGRDYYRGKHLLHKFRGAAVEYFPDTSVWNLESGNTLGLLRHGRSHTVKTDRLLICTGAMERPLPFDGWTLPGVMNAGAGQILLKSAAAVPDTGVVLAGSGPLLLLLAWQYLRAGLKVDAILDTSDADARSCSWRWLPQALKSANYFVKAARLLLELRRAGVRIETGVTQLQATGEEQLSEVCYRRKGRLQRRPAKLLLTHFGLIPNPNLGMAAGCDYQWSESQQCWHPQIDQWFRSSEEGIYLAGDGSGIGGAIAARHEGTLSALGALADQGMISLKTRDHLATSSRTSLNRDLSVRPFLERYYQVNYNSLNQLSEKELICRCEEVSLGALRELTRCEGLSCDQLKAYSRCGMGPCQGRQCGTTVSWLAAKAGTTPNNYFNIRPPVKPITLGQLAAMDSSEQSLGCREELEIEHR